MLESKLCFEDLSNEIYMEIFDYLYGQHIVSAFFSLNSRFNLLCIHYSNYHIDASDYQSFTTKKSFDHFLHLIYSKHIRSLTFRRERWIRRISIKYLLSLCSLTFIYVQSTKKIQEFLEKLPSPQHLHHLSVVFSWWQYDADLQNLLTTIFKLPNLRKFEWDSYSMRLDINTTNQPSLSLRHFSICCYGIKDFLKFVSFMPNLNSLNLTFKFDSYDFIFSISVEENSLSKLKYLQMNTIYNYNEIYCIFQLCPQVKIFKAQSNSLSFAHSMVNAKKWEELLSPMKFLQKIDIILSNARHNVVNDLSVYETDFWLQRKLKAIPSYDQKTKSRILCIKNN
jgi:hypothetical protein